MARATNDEVKAIIDTTLTAEEVNPYLNAADVMVDGLLTGRGYSANELKQITAWLAAHFVAIRDPQVSREKIGEAETTFHGKSGMGLDHTPYGQQVKIMEYKGYLVAASESKGTTEIKVIL